VTQEVSVLQEESQQLKGAVKCVALFAPNVPGTTDAPPTEHSVKEKLAPVVLAATQVFG
jgi:hypothetical protein